MASSRRSEGRPGSPGGSGRRGRAGPAGSPGGSGRRGRAGSPRARLFVALDLPAPIRQAIAHWRDQLITERDDLRPVSGDSLHVTLCFLGWRPEKEIPLIAETVAGACAGLGPAQLGARGLEPVPPRRPRLFALDLEDHAGRASAMQAAVASALAAARLFEPERRPFWPHVTLARVKRGRRAAPLEAPPAPRASAAFEASEVTLYRSTLRPQGALYEPLARTVLTA